MDDNNRGVSASILETLIPHFDHSFMAIKDPQSLFSSPTFIKRDTVVM